MMNTVKKNIKTHLFYWCTLLLLLATIAPAKAQQEPQHTMYMYNGISLNPAYAGLGDGLDAVLLHRRQWVQMDGAPNTTTFSIHSPIRESRVSLGASVISDRIGPVKSNYFNMYYAYRFPITETIKLSLGANFGIYTYNAAIMNLSRIDLIDNVLTSDQKKTSPNGGAGVMVHSHKFYVGFSMPKIFQTDFEKESDDMSEFKRHFYITAGYVFEIDEEWALKPSLFTKLVIGAPPSQDLALQVYYQNKFSLGTNYRFGDAVSFIASYYVKPQLMLGYAYDINTSALNQFNSGSHELMLTIDLGSLKKSRVTSPRYF